MKPYYDEDGITIYHGDCREILPQLGKIDVIVTDPPYGVGRKYGSGYDDSRADYWEWIADCLRVMRSIAPVVTMTHRLEAVRKLTDWDWIGCWHKPYGAGARIGNSPILPHWEPILFWGIHTLGTKRDVLQDVISVNPERSSSPVQRKMNGKVTSYRHTMDGDAECPDHPLPKPLTLMSRLVDRLSLVGETVCDPFMGSGTTLVAAKNLGRRAVGIEIEEKYCEIAAQRLAQRVFDFVVPK